MVTRKPVASAGPPPLDTSPKPPARDPNTNPPYPTTPTQTQLDRSKTIHSVGSVYSPDLNDTPAFDLIGMDEARQRPRRDSDVSSHGTWADSDEEDQKGTPDEGDIPKPLKIRASQDLREQDQGHLQQSQQKDELPSILRPGPAEGGRRVSQEGRRYEQEANANPWAAAPRPAQPDDLAAPSNNPYRQQNGIGTAAEPSQAVWQQQQPTPAVPSKPPPALPSSPPPALPVELPAVHSPTDEFASMSLGGQQPWETRKPFEAAEPSAVPQQGQLPLAEHTEAETQELHSNNPWRRPSEGQPQQHGDWSGPPDETLFQPKHAQQYAPPPGPPPKARPSAPSTSLLDQDEPMGQSKQQPTTQEPLRPAPVSTTYPLASRSTDSVPGTPQTPQTRARKQRSEHYAIKHINWYDKSSMRRSPVLTQNANGPCPLLALVNALVLSTPPTLDTALLETLRTREQVSLGLLLDAVFDELMSGRRGETAHELPDVGELYSFLLALHTGMNVNPRFITPAAAPRGSLDSPPPDKIGLHPAERAQTKAGCFEETKEMRLYSTFNVPLIHGWTPPQDAPAYKAFERSAQTFEDAQNIQFVEPELEDKLNSEGLGAQEQQTLQDVQMIKSFLNSWPTQLTDYGLENISASLKPGQFAILFRNDHFSTIYKEPKHGALMTLVTDTGYSGHDEIVWESLVDVNGAASEYFSGDFRSVSHGQGGQANLNSSSSAGGEESWQTVQRRNRSGGEPNTTQLSDPSTSTNGNETTPPLPRPRPTSRQQAAPIIPHDISEDVPATTTEQEDHDLALALQLQEEEEDRQRQAETRRRREQELSERFLSSESDGPGPPIPPRRSGPSRGASSSGPPANRAPPTRRRNNNNNNNNNNDDSGAAPPPTYEESASDRPYRPAGSTASGVLQQGNPLNAYDALRRQQSAYAQQSSSTLNSFSTNNNMTPPPPHNRRQSTSGRIGRRSSQIPATGSSPLASGGQGGVPPGAYAPPAGRPGVAGNGNGNGNAQAASVKDVERCNVM